MYKFKKESIYVFLIIMLLVIIIYPMWSSLSGYIKYRANPLKYTSQEVIISDIEKPKTGRGTNVRCYFEYDYNGTQNTGYLYYGATNKNIGDKIIIAIEKNGNYIRTDIWFNFLYSGSVLMVIISIYLILSRKKMIIALIGSMS